ncbi:Glycosyltransferase family 25 (LPS biosynthesis protein) [compost metagenome]
MNIYVISLSESSRRKIILERAASAGVTIQFIDAVNGDSLTTAEIETIYDKEQCFQKHRRGLTRNEIACFLSHIKVWEIIALSNSPSIILEDDAILAPNFKEAIESLDSPHEISDIVLLGHSKLDQEHEWYHYFKNPISNKIKHGKFAIGSVDKLWTSGMVGYWLTPRAAKIMLSENRTINTVSDNWKHHSKNLSIKEIRPYIIREDFKNLASSLEPERRALSTYKRRHYLEPLRVTMALYRNLKSLLNP